MKKLSLFLSLFSVICLSAQYRIFQKSVPQAQLTSQQKISEGLAATYISTDYFRQTAFAMTANLEFTLPGGKVISAVFEKEYKYTNGTASSVYQIKNEPNSELVLSKVDGIVTGMYSSNEGEKVIFHQTDQEIMAVSRVSENSLIQKDKFQNDVDLSFAPERANPNVCLASTAPCGNTRIDVMVVFTPQAKTAWGGLAQSKANIATAITNFNISLVNSGVSNVSINLVYCEEIPYAESGNISTDLSRFRTAGDGFMDEVPGLRSTYGADLCHLVTSTPTNTCGLGNLNTAPTNYSAAAAFSVGLYNCAVSNYTLAHEMGHNMGLNHDWYVNQSLAPCEHHHGYSNKTAIDLGAASTAAQRWRTILAYNDECASKGFNCTRINRWSNPDVTYNSESTGVPIGSPKPADEAFGFARFACVVAGFMPSAPLATAEQKANINDEFMLYPIPAREVLNIKTKKEGKYSYRITNSAGQLVKETASQTLSVKTWSAGTYFFTVLNADNTPILTKKFIVSK